MFHSSSFVQFHVHLEKFWNAEKGTDAIMPYVRCEHVMLFT